MSSFRFPRCMIGLVSTAFILGLVTACGADSVPASFLIPTPTPAVTFAMSPASSQPDLPAAEIFAKLSPAVAFLETPTASGSSVLIDGGYLLTNAHVVWPYETVRIVFPDGSEFPETPIVGWDLIADLALVGPVESEATPVPLVDGGVLDVGEDVYLIGYPGEVDAFPQPTITNGILSRLRTWETIDYTFYQVDATTVGGQSGGIMVSHAGDVIGISTFYYQGFGMAGSVSDALPRLNGLIGHTIDAELGTFPMAIGPGLTTITGTLDGERDDAFYLLDEPLGTEIELTVAGRGKPQIRVIGADGLPFANSTQYDPDGQEATVTFTVNEESPHFVKVSQPSANKNDFVLTASHPLRSHIDADDKMALTVGDRHMGNVDIPLDPDHYMLELAKGDRVEITVDALTVDPRVTVRYESPAREFVVSDDNSGGGIFGENARLVFEAPADGEYWVSVNNNRFGGTGAYFISLEEARADAEATEPSTDLELVRTGFGSMTWYESDAFDFAMLYPADWRSLPPNQCSPQATACFGGNFGTMVVLEEHLGVLPKSDRTRAQYVEILEQIFALTEEVTVDAHHKTETVQGVPADRWEMTVAPGYTKIVRQTVVDEEREIAFSVTLLVNETTFPLIKPMVDFMLESFRDWHGVDREASAVHHLDLARALASQDDDQGALEAYTKALELRPDFAEARRARGWTYYRLGDGDMAIEDLSRARELAPDDVEIAGNRAHLLWYREESDAALADIDQAIELAPENSDLYNMRALINAQRGDYDAALTDISIAEELHDGELPPNILDSRGYIYLLMGEFAKAKADYDAIFEQDLRFAYALLGGGVAYAETGEITDGLALIEEGLEQLADEEDEVYPNPQYVGLKALADAIQAD